MDIIEFVRADLTLDFWIASGLVLLLFVIQVLFYYIIYKKPYRYEQKRDKNENKFDDLPSVSVVIVSKNESENLANNLPLILEQDYPNFEVVVVNMGSTDETDILLEGLRLKYSNLYHTFVPSEAENVNEKKLALTLGIKAAHNDVLLFTEAYCKPVSNKWIEEFAVEFQKGKEIILGYNRVDIKKKFLTSQFVKYDNLIHQTKFLSMALWGSAYMGINRNLAYLKSVFFEEKGFSTVLIYDDGEDDLFINKIAKGRRVGVVVSENSMTTTDIVSKFSIWRSLKSKYLYSKKFYKGFQPSLFAFESLSKYLFYITSLAAIIYGVLFSNYLIVSVASLFLLLRFVIVLGVVNKLSGMFNKTRFHINLIFFEIFQPINNYKFRRRIKKRKRKR